VNILSSALVCCSGPCLPFMMPHALVLLMRSDCATLTIKLTNGLGSGSLAMAETMSFMFPLNLIESVYYPTTYSG